MKSHIGNDSEEDVLGVRTYQLKLCIGNKLLLHDAFYGPRAQCFLVFYFLMRLGFSFDFSSNDLDIFCNANLFGHATLKGGFIVLNLDENYRTTSYAFVSYFDFDSESVKWHPRLGHVGQDIMRQIAK